MKNFTLALVGALVLSGSAFASGFLCTEGSGYNVKLYNSTSATRTPAMLVVSHDEASPRTLLAVEGAEIRKVNRANTVQYVVDGAELGVSKAILQIAFKEGREVLEPGETVDGQLILASADGGREVIGLSCARYLKH